MSEVMKVYLLQKRPWIFCKHRQLNLIYLQARESSIHQLSKCFLCDMWYMRSQLENNILFVLVRNSLFEISI